MTKEKKMSAVERDGDRVSIAEEAKAMRAAARTQPVTNIDAPLIEPERSA